MRKFQPLLFGLTLLLLMPGCGLFKRKPKAPEEAPKTVLIGVVEMVSPEQNYVLIRCEQMPDLAAGAELTALDATGTESKLKLTPERKNRYLTADIVQGSPRVANLVLYKRSAQATQVPPGAPPTIPAPAPLIPTTSAMPMPVLPVTGLPEAGNTGFPTSPSAPMPMSAPTSPPPSVDAGQFPLIDLEPPVQ